MSGTIPTGAIVDKDGRPTQQFSALLQALIASTGGQAWTINLKRVSDTEVAITLKGLDGITRQSDPITLS